MAASRRSASAFVGNESEKSAWAGGARIGWLVTPTFLTYFSGGYTQAHFDPISFHTSALLGAPAAGIRSPANTYNGWFLGSGFEYAISFLPCRLLPEKRIPLLDLPGCRSVNLLRLNRRADRFYVNSKKYVQTIRSELVWRFNWH